MSELGVWEPLTPAAVTEVFAPLAAPWWIAGDLALNAFLGFETREHGDVDVAVLRRDQLAVQALLSGWDLQAEDPPGKMHPWQPGEMLPEGVRSIWCRPSAEAAWGVALTLEEAYGAEWEYRNSAAVHRPLAEMTWERDETPYVVPEVQLLYKAAHRSPREEADFATCLPHLNTLQRLWLVLALNAAHPGHPWIERLDEAGSVQ